MLTNLNIPWIQIQNKKKKDKNKLNKKKQLPWVIEIFLLYIYVTKKVFKKSHSNS